MPQLHIAGIKLWQYNRRETNRNIHNMKIEHLLIMLTCFLKLPSCECVLAEIAMEKDPITTTYVESALDPDMFVSMHYSDDTISNKDVAWALDQMHAFFKNGLYFYIIKVKRKAKIKNRYNQVPHLILDTIWESDNTQENVTHKRAKRSALS